ncbi:MAG TPA: hypothetical protein VHW00_06045 [Thermoanaerobaculia bacterium]|nr:hypothetical protein [Thermoanaerobaculia bacterium]
MSDFFTHLAARALAPPTLRPRTPSRFESANAPEGVEPGSEEREVPRIAAKARRDPSVAEELTPRANAGVPGKELHHEHTREVVRESTTRIVEHHGEVRDVRVDVAREGSRAAAPERRADPVIQKNADVETRAPRSDERTRETRIETRQRELVPQSPRPAPARTNARIPTPPGTPASAEPVIQVSIGRVEVRAVAQQAPQRASRRNAAMTIDDYVARKNAKERR